nr:hypothetical protein [uncultured Carboxylicivirga sp.]
MTNEKKVKTSNSMKKEVYTIQNRIDLIIELDNKILSILKSIKDKKWDSIKDSRMLFIRYISEMNSNTIFQLSFQAESHSKLTDKDWIKSRLPHLTKQIDGLGDINTYSENRHNNISSHLFDNLIINYFSEFETRIRSIVRNLQDVKHLQKKDGSFLIGNEPFTWIYRGLLESYLEFEEKDYEVIKMFSAIRNTIHNSGIFFSPDNKNKVIEYKGVTYEFEYGKPVNFLTAEFKKDILIDLLEVFSKVISHEKIINVEYIKDPLADVTFE